MPQPFVPKVINLKVGHFEDGKKQLIYDLDLRKGSDGFRFKNPLKNKKQKK